MKVWTSEGLQFHFCRSCPTYAVSTHRRETGTLLGASRGTGARPLQKSFNTLRGLGSARGGPARFSFFHPRFVESRDGARRAGHNSLAPCWSTALSLSKGGAFSPLVPLRTKLKSVVLRIYLFYSNDSNKNLLIINSHFTGLWIIE